LHELVNDMSRQGRGLRAHQAVITGSYAGAIPVPLGQDIDVRFGALGVLRARFKPA
jgi:2-keto-4-pentenoate hydratase